MTSAPTAPPAGESAEASTPFCLVSYAEFGEEFFRRAVNEDRVLAAVNVLAGRPVEIGPVGVGPGRLVKVTARGDIGAARSDPVDGPEVCFRVTLPVSLSFEIDLGLEVQRFRATLSVPLVIAARAAEGLVVFLDIVAPRREEIGIDVRADGLRASLVQRVAGIEGEVQRFVAAYIERELGQPYVRQARVIDVAGAIDMAWERLSPRVPSPAAAPVGARFRDAPQHTHARKDG